MDWHGATRDEVIVRSGRPRFAEADRRFEGFSASDQEQRSRRTRPSPGSPSAQAIREEGSLTATAVVVVRYSGTERLPGYWGGEAKTL